MKRLPTTIAALALLALTFNLAAEDAAPATGSPWKGSLGLAYLATSGNTDTSSLGLDFTMKRAPDPWGLEVVALFTRADENGVTTAERYMAGVRGTRALNDRWGLFAGLSGEKDEFAGYDLLALVEVGATYQALTGPRHLLSFDLGLTYTDESRIPPSPDTAYAGAVAGLGYEWKISETASLTERLVFHPNFEESDDWRMSSVTALQAAVSSRLAVKVGYEVRYRNQPIGANDDTDTTTKVSLVLNL